MHKSHYSEVTPSRKPFFHNEDIYLCFSLYLFCSSDIKKLLLSNKNLTPPPMKLIKNEDGFGENIKSGVSSEGRIFSRRKNFRAEKGWEMGVEDGSSRGN